MDRTAQFYGIDIEIDTHSGIVDPMKCAISKVAVSVAGLDEVLDGDETEILLALDRRLRLLPPGVLATWNGATYDLPFIADRARLLGVDLGLNLCLDRSVTLGRSLLPGHAGAYRAAWGHHSHVDTFRLFNAGVGGGARGGPQVIAHTRPSLNRRDRATADLLAEAVHARCSSDARLARVLAGRHCHSALRLADQVAPADAQVVAVALERIQRLARRAGTADRQIEPMPIPTVIAGI